MITPEEKSTSRVNLDCLSIHLTEKIFDGAFYEMSSDLIFQGKMTHKETVNCIRSSKNRIGSDPNCQQWNRPAFQMDLYLSSPQ
jgi:hypothetical protein